MKKFSFKLDGFLKLKKQTEQQKIVELSLVVGRIEQKKQQVNAFYQESARLLANESALMRAGQLDFELARNTRVYLQQLEKRKRMAENAISGMQAELVEKQRAVAEARKERRVLEILREKRLAEHVKKAARLELAELDEYNLYKK